MKVLVTGANGHIGANVVRDLLEHDYEPVPFVREHSDQIGLEGVDLEARYGDITDAAAVLAATDGCEAILHLASPYAVWAKDPNEIVRPAVQGTEAVLKAAREHGVAKVVVTSSVNTLGIPTKERGPLDETAWREQARNPYMKAKYLGERRAWELAEDLDVDLVTVLPTVVLGRLDYRSTPSTAPFVAALNGKAPLAFPMNVVDVRDVARGHVLALEKGRPGERYILGGDNCEMDEMADLIEALLGKRPATGLPPRFILLPVAYLLSGVAAITGKQPMITPDLVRELVPGACAFYDVSKARNELGLEPRGAAEVIRETARWAKHMGTLAPARAAHAGDALAPDPTWVAALD